jgi:hypothetical protein
MSNDKRGVDFAFLNLPQKRFRPVLKTWPLPKLEPNGTLSNMPRYTLRLLPGLLSPGVRRQVQGHPARVLSREAAVGVWVCRPLDDDYVHC